jgi:hypothetical protein
MSAGKIESIRRITQKLSAQEVEAVRTYIGSFSRKFGEYTPKTLSLFNVINDNTEKYSEAEIKRRVFPEGDKDNTFVKLLSRLQEKIYEGLTLEVNLKRPNTYSKAILSLYQLRKNTITAQILYTRGMVKEALALIAKSQRTAIRHHYYNELFSLLNLKYIAMNFTFGEKEARQVEKDILYYRELRAVHEKAELYFNSLAFRDRKQANTQIFLDELKSRIDDLAAEPYLYKVNVAQYYLGQLKTQYERLQGHHREMEKNAWALLGLMQANASLQNRPRMANVYKNLADACLFTGKYDTAREYADKTRQLLIPYSQNYFEMEMFFFRTYFHQEDYRKAFTHLREIERLTREHPVTDPFYTDQLRYFQAYTLFMQGKYKEANKLLQRLNELANDKEGWNIALRILQVLIRIGQQDYTQADYLVDNLNHYVSHPTRRKLVKRRDYLLSKLLYKLMQKEYNYDALSASSSDILHALEKDPKVQWQFFTPELVPVHAWLRSQTK